MDALSFRQVHLDFHTSEAIPGIGKDWDAGHFQQMLRKGHVSSITVFSKCHHGWSYHPTEVPLSRTHPHLEFDLLGEMISAAHAIGVKTPIYISAGLDEKLVRTHSHWLRRSVDGATTWTGWTKPGYHEFCLRSPYLDYLIAQTEEVVRRYEGDGIFLDIVGPRDCACQTCMAELTARGQDPRDSEARLALGRETYLNYARRINAAIHAIRPGLRVFHNSGHIRRGDREVAELDTHLELESLPTGGWGYDHFPLSARYVQGLGKEFLGMTGKFHTTWGEFGGYKHPNALRYEAALSLANGARVSVGDQMHPYGRLDPATYGLIGAAYAEVEAKEPWCVGARSLADVAVLSAESVARADEARVGPAAMMDAGAVRVLQEGGVLYDVVDAETELAPYSLLVLPDAIRLEGALLAKVRAFMAGGGKILASGDSARDPDTGQFALEFGARWTGLSDRSPEYIAPRFELADWGPAAFVVYSPMHEVEVTHGEVLADRQQTFFNRDFLHFCSHQHAPSTLEAAGAAMVGTTNTTYIAFPAFGQYAEHGQNVLREIVLHGLRRLLPKPRLVTNLPAQGIQTLMRQDAPARTVAHLLYASPARRGQGIEVVEDLPELRDVDVTLRTDTPPARVYLAPQGADLPFRYENGAAHTRVPAMRCHQMVVFE